MCSSDLQSIPRGALERRHIAVVRARDDADPSPELLLDAREEVLGRGEAADEDDRVDLDGDFGELEFEEREDLVWRPRGVSGIWGERARDGPMMGSKTSRLITRPGMTSSPESRPMDGSLPSSGLKQLNRNNETAHTMATISSIARRK